MEYETASEYVEHLVGPGNESISKAFKKSLEMRPYGVEPIDPPRGRLLELAARIRSAKRILEIGPGVGYSALWFFQGTTRDCRLEVIEVNRQVAAEFEKTMKRAGCRGNITIHHGEALEVLPKLKGHFDIVFIDANKDEYPDYLRHSMRLTRVGSIILADNLFWHGSVLSGKGREGKRGIIKYTKMIFRDKRLCSLIVPLGDGVGVSLRVK